VDHEPVLVFEGFNALVVAAERFQPVRQDLVEAEVHPLEKLKDVLQEDPRIDVAPAVFELNNPDPMFREEGSAALEYFQFVPFHVHLQEVDSLDSPLAQ
jgi:hypothetical protein